jgi:anaerobic selenocysteine-containing dehydrogenase
MSASARRADVVLAPSQCLEREDITNLSEWWHETAYARYTEALADAPGDTIDEYEMLWTIGKHLGVQMKLPGGDVPMDACPSKQDFLDLMVAGCIVAPSQVREDARKASGSAIVYEDLHPIIQPYDEDQPHRFQLAAGDMPTHLERYGSDEAKAAGFDFKMISRRSKGRFNSIGQPLKNLGKKVTTNPAYIHPDDLSEQGIAEGDIIEITSAHASIHGVAKPSDRVRRGLISMAHAFGDADAGKHNVQEMGGSTNRLTSEEVNFDPITGQSLQSAIPVKIAAA